jgi:hypothetical protein
MPRSAQCWQHFCGRGGSCRLPAATEAGWTRPQEIKALPGPAVTDQPGVGAGPARTPTSRPYPPTPSSAAADVSRCY